MEDIDHAIANAQKILASTMDGGPEVFYQKSDADQWILNECARELTR
jgi:hypothetical protein